MKFNYFIYCVIFVVFFCYLLSPDVGFASCYCDSPNLFHLWHRHRVYLHLPRLLVSVCNLALALCKLPSVTDLGFCPWILCVYLSILTSAPPCIKDYDLWTLNLCLLVCQLVTTLPQECFHTAGHRRILQIT